MVDKNKENITGELINRCKQGDRLAEFEIYRLYYKAMYNVSLRIVSRADIAEDIMQEAFLSAFRKITTFKGEVSFGAWLKRIVINKSIDFLRERKIRFEEYTAYRPEDLEESEYIYFNEEGDTEKKVNEIKKAMQMLPDGYRIVLSLSLFEGYDHEEIAQILSVSESTSRSQLARAKKKLVEMLKNK
jgi:RNA polymerase sigma-70 factor (ECF subfamily)